jgi:uridine kinase
MVDKQKNKKQVQIILIAGGSASGKTTVANQIANHIFANKPVTHLSMDNYYKDLTGLSLAERRKENFDHPNAFDIDLLVKHLKMLKQHKAIEVPVYDFSINNRTEKTIHVEPSEVIILDGILTLHVEKVRQLGDIKLFIKTADDIRFIRRLQRDVKERGYDVNYIVDQYLTTVKPMHDFFVAPSIDFADVIIPYYEGNDVAIDLVATKIASLVE